MFQGEYQAYADTPMGRLNGKLVLQNQNGSLSGSLDAMGMRTEFQNGRIQGNQCQFEGAVKTPFGKFAYSVTGKATGNQVILEVKSEKGTFQIIGQKKER